MDVCVYDYVHVYACVRRVRAYVCAACTWVRACMRACVHACVSVRVCVCVCVCVCVLEPRLCPIY